MTITNSVGNLIKEEKDDVITVITYNGLNQLTISDEQMDSEPGEDEEEGVFQSYKTNGYDENGNKMEIVTEITGDDKIVFLRGRLMKKQLIKSTKILFIIILVLAVCAIYFIAEIYNKKIDSQILLTYLIESESPSQSIWETKTKIYYQDVDSKIKSMNRQFTENEFVIDKKVDQYMVDDRYIVYTYRTKNNERIDFKDIASGNIKKIYEDGQWIQIVGLHEGNIYFSVCSFDKPMANENFGLYEYNIDKNESRKISDDDEVGKVVIDGNMLYCYKYDFDNSIIIEINLGNLKRTKNVSMENIAKLFPDNKIDGYIYYVDNRSYEHRVKLDLSGDTKLFDGDKLNSKDRCIKDNYIFYISDVGLCKREIDTESSLVTILDKSASRFGEVQIINGWIFYCIGYENDMKYARININGGKAILGN